MATRKIEAHRYRKVPYRIQAIVQLLSQMQRNLLPAAEE